MNNRHMVAVAAALNLLCAASVTVADTLAGASPDPNAKAAKKTVDARVDDQTIVCKREDTTGSRLGATKICHTRAEWAGMAAQAREQSDRMINVPQTH